MVEANNNIAAYQVPRTVTPGRTPKNTKGKGINTQDTPRTQEIVYPQATLREEIVATRIGVPIQEVNGFRSRTAKWLAEAFLNNPQSLSELSSFKYEDFISWMGMSESELTELAKSNSEKFAHLFLKNVMQIDTEDPWKELERAFNYKGGYLANNEEIASFFKNYIESDNILFLLVGDWYNARGNLNKEAKIVREICETNEKIPTNDYACKVVVGKTAESVNGLAEKLSKKLADPNMQLPKGEAENTAGLIGQAVNTLKEVADAHIDDNKVKQKIDSNLADAALTILEIVKDYNLQLDPSLMFAMADIAGRNTDYIAKSESESSHSLILDILGSSTVWDIIRARNEEYDRMLEKREEELQEEKLAEKRLEEKKYDEKVEAEKAKQRMRDFVFLMKSIEKALMISENSEELKENLKKLGLAQIEAEKIAALNFDKLTGAYTQ